MRTSSAPPSIVNLLAGHVAEVAVGFSTMVAIINTPTMAQRTVRFNEAQRLTEAALAELCAWTRPDQRRILFDAMTIHGLPSGVAARGVSATVDEVAAWSRHRSRAWDRQ